MPKGVSNRVLLVIPRDEAEALVQKYLYSGKRIRKTNITADQVVFQVLEV